MDKANLNIRMEIIFKETTLKTRKEEKENIISMKAAFFNLNLIPILLKYQK